MTRLLSLTLLFLIHCYASGQSIKNTVIAKLDKQLKETSGLIYFNNSYWTINDSGDKPCLYQFNCDGNITQTITIANASNIDWEDIAQDEQNIYIADMGNNSGNRHIFTIYAIAKSKLLQTSNDTTLTAKAYTLRYADQKKNLKPYAHDFDCEALVCINNQLGVFTKNWASGNSNFYTIDLEQQIAKLNKGYETFGLVTGADYCRYDDTMYLIGYQSINLQFLPFLIIINDFTNESGHTLIRHQLSNLNGSQTEGICISNEGIVISNEQTQHFPASISKLEITN